MILFPSVAVWGPSGKQSTLNTRKQFVGLLWKKLTCFFERSAVQPLRKVRYQHSLCDSVCAMIFSFTAVAGLKTVTISTVQASNQVPKTA